jgi:hypothetical protein
VASGLRACRQLAPAAEVSVRYGFQLFSIFLRSNRRIFCRRIEGFFETTPVEVTSRSPSPPRDVSQPGRDEHQRALAIGESIDDPRSAANFPHDAFQRVVRPDPRPVFVGERRTSKRSPPVYQQRYKKKRTNYYFFCGESLGFVAETAMIFCSSSSAFFK